MALQDEIKKRVEKGLEAINHGQGQKKTGNNPSPVLSNPGNGGIHQSVNKLPAVSQGKAWARLETIDGKEVYDFLVNPEQLSHGFSAELESLSIAGTNQPLQRWKSSDRSLRVPDFLMFSPNRDRNLSGSIARLESWTQGKDGKLPLLKFSWGAFKLDRCYLQSLEYSTLESRGGNPTYIKGSLVIVPAPETPKIRTEFSGGDIFTDRERQDLVGRIQQALNRNKEWMKKYGIYAESKIDVTPEGDVMVDTNGKKENLGNFKPITDFLFGSPTQKN